MNVVYGAFVSMDTYSKLEFILLSKNAMLTKVKLPYFLITKQTHHTYSRWPYLVHSYGLITYSIVSECILSKVDTPIVPSLYYFEENKGHNLYSLSSQ